MTSKKILQQDDFIIHSKVGNTYGTLKDYEFDLGKLFIEWRRIVPNGVPNLVMLSPRSVEGDLSSKGYGQRGCR